MHKGILSSTQVKHYRAKILLSSDVLATRRDYIIFIRDIFSFLKDDLIT